MDLEPRAYAHDRRRREVRDTVREHRRRGTLSNGYIAVANSGGTNDIRIFDARARRVTTFGRTGEGPGEFRRLEWIGRSGDTTWFYDSGLRRITTVLLGTNPELLGTTRVTANGNGRVLFVNGRLPDGRYVVATPVSPTVDGPPEYVVLDAAGRLKGRVAVPGGSRVREAGLDYVILVHEDTDGVESVRLYGLDRR